MYDQCVNHNAPFLTTVGEPFEFNSIEASESSDKLDTDELRDPKIQCAVKSSSNTNYATDGEGCDSKCT